MIKYDYMIKDIKEVINFYDDLYKKTLTNKYMVKANCIYLGKYTAYKDVLLYIEQLNE